MIRISFINNKGGVGKTISAFNVASYLHKKKFKVLLIDLDAQANLTIYSKINPISLEHTVYDLMLKESSIGEKLTVDDIHSVIKKTKDGMDIIPSNIGAERINQNLLHAINKEGILNSILNKIEFEYDVCIIDSPPNLGLAANNGIVASDYVFIPIKAGPWELIGMRMLSGLINALKEVSKRDTKIGGIFFTQYVSFYNISKTMEDALKENNFTIMNTKISNSVKIVEAAKSFDSVFEYGKKDNIPYKDYEELSKEIMYIAGIKKTTKKKGD